MPGYCEFSQADPIHKPYHDSEYGFPLRDDAALFERLALEINQAGLSWTLILKKKDAFRRAFEGFDPERVASYGPEEEARLLQDAAIIRNRRKIQAVIENARRLLQLRQEHGSFAGWLDHHHPRRKEEWIKLFKQTFVFTGGEVVGEFLVSTGYLPGAHEPGCPVYRQILELNPPWLRISQPERPWMPEDYGVDPKNLSGLIPWERVRTQMAAARNYWISSTRPDGRSHAMPVWGVWLDERFYFGTSRGSRKARNLAANPQVVVHLESGDEAVIFEGSVEEVTDPSLLARIAAASAAKYEGYDPDPAPNPANIFYVLKPRLAMAWLEREFLTSPTRWRFD